MKLEPSLDTLQPPIELRVLIGPQAGSCLSLAIGDYALGTSDDCEIILTGPRLEAVHARLSFDGDQILIVPVDGKVCDAQGNEIQDTFPLSLGMPVDLGGIWISIDNADAPWPDPADVLPLPPKSEPGSAISNEKKPNGPVNASIGPLRRRAKVILAISGLSLIVVLVTGIAAFAWLLKRPKGPVVPTVSSTPASPAIPASRKKIEQIISNFDLAQAVEIKISDQGIIHLIGYVPEESTKIKLMQAMENISPQPQITLYVDSELLALTKKVINEKLDPARAKLNAESVKYGLLRVKGAVLMQSVKDSAFDTLRAEVPGLRQIEGAVIQAEDIPQQFQEKILSAGLSKKLQVVSRQPEFVLRGALTEDELHTWETVLTELNEEYGKVLPIKATIRLIQKKSPVNLQIVVGGNMPFVITDNGNRVTRGGDVDGHTLITIKDTEVIFEGNEKVKISR